MLKNWVVSTDRYFAVLRDRRGGEKSKEKKNESTHIVLVLLHPTELMFILNLTAIFAAVDKFKIFAYLLYKSPGFECSFSTLKIWNVFANHLELPVCINVYIHVQYQTCASHCCRPISFVYFYIFCWGSANHLRHLIYPPPFHSPAVFPITNKLKCNMVNMYKCLQEHRGCCFFAYKNCTFLKLSNFCLLRCVQTI